MAARNYATDNNTEKITCTSKDKKGKIIYSVEFIIWRTAENRFNNIPESTLFLLAEIYRRLRKFPEFDGSVAILFNASVYAICDRHNCSIEEYTEVMETLLKKEIVNVVHSTSEYTVYSLDRSIFVTNYIYYRESGTDSKACSDFFNTSYEVEKTSDDSDYHDDLPPGMLD